MLCSLFQQHALLLLLLLLLIFDPYFVWHTHGRVTRTDGVYRNSGVHFLVVLVVNYYSCHIRPRRMYDDVCV